MSWWSQVTWRPIERWHGERNRRPKPSPFRSTWTDTIELLERELRRLNAKNVVVQAALTEADLRLDGRPRASARFEHQGVILTMDTPYGPLQYPCDTFDDWQDNIRAIALALEALRKVDRYGVTKRGEQYTGWKALGTGETNLVERGRELIAQHGSESAALKATHPDHGGNADDLRAVQAARKAGAS